MHTPIVHDNFQRFCENRLEEGLLHLLLNLPASPLQEAIAFSVHAGGKRLRPLLVYAAADLVNGNWQARDATAQSIELMHTYSLIHDDLPSMDNADLRRGLPSCHRQFSEALAILAGDALQTLAFEILTAPNLGLQPLQQLRMLELLSKAAGARGMVLGQTQDIDLLAPPTTLHELNTLHSLKTGQLIKTAMQLGSLCGEETLAANDQFILETLAEKLGLVFQIQDDLLDYTSSTQLLGKPSQLDVRNKKITYLNFMSCDDAYKEVRFLYEEILTSLESFGASAEELKKLIIKVSHRTK